jgi:hypothetical protein
MLAYKLFGSGLNSITVEAMKDVATGLTATGTTQNDALEVTSAKNAFSTVATGAGAILDSDAAAGDTQMIYNGGANPLTVYPPSGAQINALGANAGMLLPVRTACEFYCLSTTLWTGVLSA